MMTFSYILFITLLLVAQVFTSPFERFTIHRDILNEAFAFLDGDDIVNLNLTGKTVNEMLHDKVIENSFPVKFTVLPKFF